MRARTLLVVLVAVLAIASMPASAQNASAVASEHTTFGAGSAGEPSPTTLQNMSVEGSGESASVVLGTDSTYNPVDAEGDGVAETEKEFVGDTLNDDRYTSSVGIEPSSSGKITTLTPRISSVDGTDYGVTVDVYISKGDADDTYQEGTLVKSNYDPDFATGEQTISLDTAFSVSAGTKYEVEFVSSGTDNDGVRDSLFMAVDGSAGGGWYRFKRFDESAYGDLSANIEASPPSGTFVGAPHDAEKVNTGFSNLTLSNASATVTWQEDADGDGTFTNVTATTYTTSGNKTADLSTTTSDRWRVRVDVDATDSNATARINDEGVLFASSNPGFSDPEPPDQAKIENAVGNISINVSDSDFGLVQGDNVSVSATDDDGTSLGSATLTSDGRVSVPYSSENGRNVIDWSATDEYGNTITFQQTFTTPSQLIVKNESAPSQTVNNSGTITATFFGDEGKTVVERSTTNARFNLTGLPTDTTYIVQIDVNGFRSRQVVITSLFDQQTVFLLPDDAPAAQVQYILDDKTGEFAAQETRLFIDTAIRKNNSTEFRTIFADEFGASGDLRVTLRDDTRYRIRVRSPGSGERVLGSYTASGADTVTLEIGQLSFAVREQGDQSFNVSAETVTGSNETVQAVRFNYDDPTEQTSRINVSVETLNGTVVGQAQATNEPYGSFSFTQPINNSTAANATFTVKFEVTRAGETVSGQLRPGLNRYPPGVPLDNGLKQLFSVGFLLIVGGLFSATNARVGAVVTPLFAVGLWYVEWLPPGTSILAIALALGVGVLVNYGGRR